MEISRGAVEHIYKTKDTGVTPVLQITELKRISPGTNPNSPPRFRLAVSDGLHFQQAMLATQLNKMVADQMLQLNCLVKLNDYICNEVSNKRIIIILNLEVVSNHSSKIGNPVPVDGPKQEPTGMPGMTSGVPPMNNAAPPVQSSGTFGGGANGGSWNAVPPTNAYGPTGNTPVKMERASPYGRSGSGVMSTAGSSPGGSFRSINSINPYQNGWSIRGRCTYKSDLRKWQNARGEGQVISFELTDESGSIRITGFTEHAPRVDEVVHIGRLYTVKGGTLKHANEKWNRSTSQYEMTLDRRSEFSELPDDGNTIKVKYNFTKIAALESIATKGTCDVLAIVQTVGPMDEITIRSTGDKCKKRSIIVCDDSNAAVELTLWRNQAENFLKEEDQNRHPVILLKNAMRGDFGGVCLNTGRSTSIELDPVNVPEANQLRAWFDSQGGASAPMQSLTATRGGANGKVMGERKTLEDARVEDVDPSFGGGGGGGNTTFNIRGFVSFIKSDGELSYPSDPETKKKVTMVSPGVWHNAAMDRQLQDHEVMHRYIMNLKIADHTGSQWMTAFDESGQVIIGKSANEMRQMKDNDIAMFQSVVDDAKFRPFVMRIQVREDEYKGETKLRYTISRCEPVSFASEARLLLQEIKSYE